MNISRRAVCGRQKFSLLLPVIIFVIFMVALPTVGYCAAETTTSGSALGDKVSGKIPDWAQVQFMGVAVWQMIAAFILILVGLVMKKISDYLFQSKIIPLLERTSLQFDNSIAEAASKPVGCLLALLGLAGALSFVPLPTEPDISAFADALIKVLLGADFIWFLFRLIDALVSYLKKLAAGTGSGLDDKIMPVIRKALKVTVGILCGVWIVQLLGYRVSSLLTGLGIGGLAVALALQDTLGNFFGSVFMFLDRPFEVGDWVKMEDVDGFVEQIGFRSTRVRTWDGTLVSVPNKNVANATIDNWSRMQKRRVQQTIGLTYETSPDEMEEAVEKVREIIRNDEGVDDEFIVVRFAEFGGSSLNILVYYYTVGLGLDEHLETKERINLAIMREIRVMGLSMA
ncbi:MAG: mechanosensitive ion channel family protein, partial [Planctomycetes bacterium]|nr:mechanosensitive ion channel family protein [Planctomycetota bacterium]